MPTLYCESSPGCCSFVTAGKKSWLVRGQRVPLGSLFGAAGIIELVLGSLITIGLLTGTAAFIASGEMAVAYFIGHFPKSFGPLKTPASRRCCSASFFCIWRLKVRGSEV
jgi:uncharacterized membrane protein YphA (DoxX/SURF4 family)